MDGGKKAKFSLKYAAQAAGLAVTLVTANKQDVRFLKQRVGDRFISIECHLIHITALLSGRLKLSSKSGIWRFNVVNIARTGIVWPDYPLT